MNHDVMKAPARTEALADFLKVWTFTPETEYVPLAESLGRVTAEDLHACYAIPRLRISSMDGYAVHSAAFADGRPDVTSWVPGVDFTPADTGDDFPDEFDSVIQVEMLHYGEDGTLVLEDKLEFKPGMGIRPAGCMMQPGDLLVQKNTTITPELLANLAAGGIRNVPVLRKPVVAFIPTGSELTAAGLEPLRGQNVESNSLMIGARLEKWGAKVVRFPIVRDDPELLEQAMNEALRFADIVLMNGGSSKGTEDFNSRMMERRATYFMHTVRTVPGRPVGISLIDGKPVINLPGPVLAAWTVSDWLLHPMVSRWLGVPMEARQKVTAVLTTDHRKGPPVEVYSMAHLEKRGETYYVTPLSRGVRNSEMLRDGNAILIAPIGGFGYRKDEKAEVELLVPESCIPVTAAENAAAVKLPENCDQCPNHCPIDHLQCGRGRAHLEQLKNGDIFESGSPVVDALIASAGAAKHMGKMMQAHGKDPSEVLSALTPEERDTLLALLQKQQAKWNADHAARHAGKHGGEHGGPHIGPHGGPHA